MQRKSTPLKWTASTACDALDGTSAPNGGMALLQNLIPDPTTKGYWQGRPASVRIKTTNFLVCGRIVGNIFYGMASNAGLDVPVAVDLVTAALYAVTGTQNATTLPATQFYPSQTQPLPQMDVVGTRVIVAHPGFSPTATAAGNYFGWFDISTPTSPVWHAGQLTGGFITFSVPPIAVKQMFNRAYYIHNAAAGPAVIFSDILNPINCSNANQVLTFDDLVPLNALGQLPLSNLLGGMLQSLVVFKGTQAMYQIQGDAALNTLSLNQLAIHTGTLAPNSICPTPKGLAFISPEGLRFIGFDSSVSDPIGIGGQGICQPFQVAYAAPSTCVAACSGNVIRITVLNGLLANAAQEWWYHMDRGIWSGPHTFPASLIWQWGGGGIAGNQFGDTFVLQPIQTVSLPGVWRSDYQQSAAPAFIENGVQIVCTWKTVMLPDAETMNNVCVTESFLDVNLGTLLGGSSATVQLLDIEGNPITGGSLVISPIAGFDGVLRSFLLPWTAPMVFKKAFVAIAFNGQDTITIGPLRLRYQILRAYQEIVNSVVPTPSPFTFDPAHKGTHATLSGGNLVLTGDGTNNDASCFTTVSATSGRYYAEMVQSLGTGGAVGVCNVGTNLNNFLGNGTGDWGYYDNGTIFSNGALVTTIGTHTTADVISIAVSATEGYVWIAINGAWQTGNPVTSTFPTFTYNPVTVGPIYLVATSKSGSRWTANFGGSAFAYTPPQGFQAWNTIGE